MTPLEKVIIETMNLIVNGSVNVIQICTRPSIRFKTTILNPTIILNNTHNYNCFTSGEAWRVTRLALKNSKSKSWQELFTIYQIRLFN